LSLQSFLSVYKLFKSTYIKRLLKKSNLGTSDVKAYQPIFHSSVQSKLYEQQVARQLTAFPTVSDLLPKHVTAGILPRHFTETAVLGILGATHASDLLVPALLEPSAVFLKITRSYLNGSSCILVFLVPRCIGSSLIFRTAHSTCVAS
jgi:hypothetical protein